MKSFRTSNSPQEMIWTTNFIATNQRHGQVDIYQSFWCPGIVVLLLWAKKYYSHCFSPPIQLQILARYYLNLPKLLVKQVKKDMPCNDLTATYTNSQQYSMHTMWRWTHDIVIHKGRTYTKTTTNTPNIRHMLQPLVCVLPCNTSWVVLQEY